MRLHQFLIGTTFGAMGIMGLLNDCIVRKIMLVFWLQYLLVSDFGLSFGFGFSSI